MSGLSNLFSWTDVLSQSNLKPWWETLRGYFVGLMFTSVFFMVYNVNPSKELHCRAYPLNSRSELTRSDVEYLRSACYLSYAEENVLLVSIGFTTLIAASIIYAVYSLWLAIPRVVQCFEIARKADEAFKGMKIADTEMKMALKEIYKDDAPFANFDKVSHEDAATIINVCGALWVPDYERQLCVSTLYFLRNLISTVFLGASAYVPCRLLMNLEFTYTCNVAVANYERMICSSSFPYKILPSLILLLVSEAGLVVINIALIFWQIHREGIKVFQMAQKKDARKRENEFANWFGGHSAPLGQKTISTLCAATALPGGVGSAPSPGSEEFFIRVKSRLTQKLAPIDDEYMKSIREACAKAIRKKDYRKFVTAHTEVFKKVPGSAKMNYIGNTCGCRDALPAINLQDIDDKRSSFMYHILHDVDNNARVELFIHVLHHLRDTIMNSMLIVKATAYPRGITMADYIESKGKDMKKSLMAALNANEKTTPSTGTLKPDNRPKAMSDDEAIEIPLIRTTPT